MQCLRSRPAISTLFAAGFLLAGCVTDSGPTLKDWEGSELRVTRIVLEGAPVPIPSPSPITMTLEANGKISGRSTVNRYFGSFARNPNGSLTWTGALGATRMAGPEGAMKTESSFFAALGGTSELRVGSDLLVFQSADQKNVVEVKRR